MKYIIKASINLNFECEALDAKEAYEKYINNWSKNCKRINTSLKNMEIDDESNIVVYDCDGNKVFDENEPIKHDYNSIKYSYYICTPPPPPKNI